MTYQATIKVMGKTYSSTGETKEDVLRNLKVPSTLARGPAIVTLTKGDKSVERVLPAAISMRLFSASPSIREVHIKQAGMRFDL